jgi:hypothetical protein
MSDHAPDWTTDPAALRRRIAATVEECRRNYPGDYRHSIAADRWADYLALGATGVCARSLAYASPAAVLAYRGAYDAVRPSVSLAVCCLMDGAEDEAFVACERALDALAATERARNARATDHAA